MAGGGLGYTFKDGDWTRLRQIIQQLSSVRLGYNSTPTFNGLTIAVDANNNGGNLSVENDLTIGGDLSLTGSLTLSSLTEKSVLFAGAGGLLSQDNANFNYNSTTKFLTLNGSLAITGTPASYHLLLSRSWPTKSFLINISDTATEYVSTQPFNFGSANASSLGTWALGGLTVGGTLTLASGSISDSGNAISFGTNNLSTSGTLTLSGLTATRVPYISNGGLLIDNANFTYNGTTFNASALVTGIKSIIGSKNGKIEFDRVTNYIDIYPSGSGNLLSYSNQNSFGTSDLFLQFQPQVAGAFGVFECYARDFYISTNGGGGTKVIKLAPNKIVSLTAGVNLITITGAATVSTTLSITGLTTATGGITIGAGTADKWPLRFTDGVALTSAPVAGTVEFHDSRLYLTNVATRFAIDRSSPAIIASTTVANSDTEDLLFTQARAANCFKAGNHFKIFGMGQVSSSVPAHTVTLNVYVGTTLAGSLTTPSPTTLSDTPWHLEFYCTIRTAGAGGTMSIHGDMHIGNDGDSAINIPTTAINTETANDITITAEWSNADAGNTIQIDQAIVEFKN